MLIRATGWLIGGLVGFLFFWTVVLKMISRVAARLGHASPCPASLGWLIDNPLRSRYMHPVLQWVDIQVGEKVLELGPGPGSFTIAAARMAGPTGWLIAVDIQLEMIARVRERARTAHLTRVAPYVADARNLPLRSESIDRAFFISVLPEIPRPAMALAELQRVLKSGGIASITAEFLDPDYLFQSETIDLLEAAGFALVSRHGNWWRHTLNFRKVAVATGTRQTTSLA